MTAEQTPTPTKVGYSITEAAQAAGVCRQTIYNEINAGRLATFKVGRRRFVRPETLSAWAKTLERQGDAA